MITVHILLADLYTGMTFPVRMSWDLYVNSMFESYITIATSLWCMLKCCHIMSNFMWLLMNICSVTAYNTYSLYTVMLHFFDLHNVFCELFIYNSEQRSNLEQCTIYRISPGKIIMVINIDIHVNCTKRIG